MDDKVNKDKTINIETPVTKPVSKYEAGQKVDLVILRETDLGFVAKINNQDEGLLYHNEVFERLDPGQNIPGHIKKIRENGSIDLILQAFGNFGSDELGERILQILVDNDGFLAITDKTDAQVIYDTFGISKKKFKIALGNIYKKRLITIEPGGMRLAKKP